MPTPMTAAIRFCAAVRTRLVRVLLVEGLARALALASVVVVLAVVADRLWNLPGAVRGGLLATVFIALGSVLWARVGRSLRNDLGDRALARFAERRMPALGGRLLTAIAGIPLGAAEEARLEALLAAQDVRALLPARRTPRQVAVLGLALVAITAAVISDAGLAWDGARRLFAPWSDVPWRRHTTVVVRLPRPVVPADEPLAVEIERHHPDAGFSAPVELSWRGAASGGDARQLNGLTGTLWSSSLTLGPGTWTISAVSGDAETVSTTAQVVNRPRVSAIAATITPPAYSALPGQQAATIAGAFLPGTRLDFTVGFATDPGRQVHAATVAFIPAGGQAQPIPVDGSWAGGVTVTWAGVVEITASDADGIATAAPARFPITITPDRPPTVALSGPLPREGVTVRATVEIGLAASDDLGLATLDLLAAVPPSATEGAVVHRCPAVAGQTAVSRPAVIEIAGLAAEGSQVVFTGRASDRNDVGGPGIGRSEPLALRVITEDALRQELDRVLGEARERVVAARDALTAASEPARRELALRTAIQAAGRGDDLLQQALRRWRWNHLPDEGIAPATAAREQVSARAQPELARAGEDAGARSRADAALAEAERLLGSILQEGDLTRLLSSLIARQTALANDTRTFVRSYLTKPLDAPGKALQQNLATRQKELAEQIGEVERRLLSKEGSSWSAAQAVVRSETPGERLRSSAQDLATSDRRPSAVEAQRAAIAALNRLLEALRGGDAAGDLAKKLGQLAAEQERLASALERGAAPAGLAEAQRDLAARTQAAARAASTQPEAAKLLAGAEAAQRSAAGGMAKGDRPAAGRDASAAAGLLREAQRRLSGEAPPPAEQQKLDVLALLKDLQSAQAAIVAEVSALAAKNGEKQLDFALSREVQGVARKQGDVRLRLTEDAIKPLARNPIASLALQRVATVMEAARAHLASPALGDKGLRLTRTALAEISRLLAVAEAKPPASGGSGGNNKGGGGGGQQGPKPPFPPQAELALLAAMQQEVAALTAADRPTDLAAAQEQVQHLVESMVGATRPGTRPAELVERTRRAATSATYRLRSRDRGALTRLEQDVAELSLRRLIAESGGDDSGGGGGGGGGAGAPPPQAAGGGKDAQPQGGDGQGQGGEHAGGQAAAQAGGAQGGAKPGGEGEAVRAAATDSGDLLQLPPQLRDQLRQAREQHFTPGQLQVYQRYLELLEQAK